MPIRIARGIESRFIFLSRRQYKQRGRAQSMELEVWDEIRDKLKEVRQLVFRRS